MHVAVYHAVSNSKYELWGRFDCANLLEARTLVSMWFQFETINAAWNVKNAYMSESMLEAHVEGFCRDERTAIVLEDDSSNYLDLLKEQGHDMG